MITSYPELATPTWIVPQVWPPLGEREVHIWQAPLSWPAPYLQRFQAVLSLDEQGRAARFHFPHLRDGFIAAHGLQRIILVRYVNDDPAGLRFVTNAYGKPALLDHSIHFNISHTRDVVVLAISQMRELGVDVEKIKPDFVSEEIARRFFAPEEVAVLGSLPADARTGAFFDCWTRKEAYIKARGLGLSIPLHQFHVTLAPDQPPRLVRTEPDAPDPTYWSMATFRPDPNHAGAIVAAGKDWTLACWRITPRVLGWEPLQEPLPSL